jgi:2-polyprenyl-6-methoxyphenol hydroxylase-like FAD-dependent oxidoreductase
VPSSSDDLVNRRLDVLVVGAGPVGLTPACHLRRLGLEIRVIEKRPGPSVHSKAIGLQYRVAEVLARLGVVDRFVAQGGSPKTVNIYAGDERLVQLRFAAPSGTSGRDAFSPRAIVQMPPNRDQLQIYLSLICSPNQLQRACGDRTADCSAVDGR